MTVDVFMEISLVNNIGSQTGFNLFNFSVDYTELTCATVSPNTVHAP